MTWYSGNYIGGADCKVVIGMTRGYGGRPFNQGGHWTPPASTNNWEALIRYWGCSWGRPAEKRPFAGRTPGVV